MADTAFADPYAQRLEAQRRLLADPMRESETKRMQMLGYLGLLSGDDGASAAGQFALKGAAARQQRQDEELRRLEDRSAAAQLSYAEARLRAQERADAAREQREWREQQNELQRQMMMRLAGTNSPLVQVLQPDGRVTYVPRPEAIGAQAPGASPSEDERKASGWLQQARLAYQNMQQAVKEDPRASQVSVTETAVGSMPGVGDAASYAIMSPARQKFTTAASSLSEAVLRAATGAGVNRDEALQKVRELTPRYGEDPSVSAMKAQMAEMYLDSLQARAGRAAPQAGGTPQVFKKTLGSGQQQGGTPPADPKKPPPIRVTY